MEDDLKNLMRIIDKNSDKMPDGDYLELCNIMRDMYRAEADDETEPISARSLSVSYTHLTLPTKA